MKKVLLLMAAVPVLALFGGTGILAYRIGETWDAETTQGLVTGLTVICGGGALVVCVLLALLVGVPLAIRAYGEGGIHRRAWGLGRGAPYGDDVPPVVRRSPVIHGAWRELPPVSATPPWGVTGGGSPHLLPPPEQDNRFGMSR
jgi:hypothetical protein